MIHVALVGYGYWGPNLARCLAASARARMAAICEPRPDRAREAQAGHRRTPVVANVDEILQDPSIDAIVLATPMGTHGDLAFRTLEAGKHVLVEKPLAASSREAKALLEASQRADRVLMVDHTYLFSPAFQTIQRLIRDRGLGPVRYYHSVRANSFGPGHETGVLWDLAVHDLAILDALLPEPPSAVEAVGLRSGSSERESHVQLNLSYHDQAIASVLVSWISPVKLRTIVVGFDRHTVWWDDLVSGGRVELFDRGLKPVPDPDDLRQRHSVSEAIPIPHGEPLAAVVDHFLACIGGDRPCRSGPDVGQRTIRVLEAAEQALAVGGPQIVLESGAVAL